MKCIPLTVNTVNVGSTLLRVYTVKTSTILLMTSTVNMGSTPVMAYTYNCNATSPSGLKVAIIGSFLN